MSRFDRNKVSCDLSNNAYSKQIKVVNKNFKSNGVISVNGQDGEVILNYIDHLEKGIPEGVAPLNSEGIIDEQYLPSIGPNLSFENGLREEDGVVKLGLDLTDPTYSKGVLTESLYLLKGEIIGDYALLSIRDDFSTPTVTIDTKSNDRSTSSITSSGNPGTARVVAHNISTETSHFIGLLDDRITLGIVTETNSPSVGTPNIGLKIRKENFTIYDGINYKGLTYITDFSTNGKLDDRWIPDWGAVKGYVDSKASPFNVIDVTEEIYQDKAINVIPFNNTGISYSEGSIDFGVTRHNHHTMGLYAFKQGVDTTASGESSTAFGNLTTASGYASVAFGTETKASDTASSAFGYLSTASGLYSTAFGGQTIASGIASSAFGTQTIASGFYSTAFGYSSVASSYASSAFGLDSIANEYASLAIGRYSTDGVVETSWTTGSPIFKVGNGTGGFNRSNAYVLNNDGTSTQYGIASYGADYSSSFTDRSLVDKAYVDSKSAEPVSDAADEADVVVKFNQLLENMRLSGLLKT